MALKLKRSYPKWGLDVLLLDLRRRPSLRGKKLPGRTALYHYLRPYMPRLQLARQSRTKRPSPVVSDTRAVHERWQIDFKGKVKVEEREAVLPLNVCDEHSSAPLAGFIFTNGTGQPHRGLTSRDVQQALRAVFTRWGRPQQLRMDRDGLFVGSSRLEWPGVLLLWLVGLGIEPVINRPGRPTDNAQVERLNLTWCHHVGTSRLTRSAAQLQLATDLAWLDRLFHLPSHNKQCLGQPPASRFPELFANPRPYYPHREADSFDIRLVHAYLATWQWQRKVDATGCISLSDTNRLVSKSLRGQIVRLHFDPDTALFVASTLDRQPVKRFNLPAIDPDWIMGTGSLL